MRTLLQDLRYALRMMRKTPALSLGVIATLTLTLGASAAIFSVLHAVLLRRLPYREPDRLVAVWSRQTVREKAPWNLADYLDLRDEGGALAGLSALAPWNATLGGAGEPERLQGLRVTADLFETLGVEAELGRALRPEDDRPGAPRVVVLTHGLWTRRFGADPAILGAPLILDGDSFTVVGVLPVPFLFPMLEGGFAAPLAPDLDPQRAVRASMSYLRLIGRLRPGVARERAGEALSAVAARLARELPESNARKVGATLVPLADELVGRARASLLALAAAVAGLLIIACANLANLMLARGSARATEIATRLALGATRARLLRQLLTESLVLAAFGGLGGAVAATAGVDLLLALAPADVPRLGQVAVDGAVLLFTAAATVTAGVAFGLIPAIVLSRADLGAVLKDGARGASEGPGRRRARGVLVAAEVAIAVLLSVAAGLLARSLANLEAVRLGFDAAGVVTARVVLPPARYRDRQAIAAYQQRALERIGPVPAGAVSALPLAGQLVRVDFSVAGRATPRARVPAAQYRIITPGYLAAMRIPRLRGRDFADADGERTAPVALVNEALARRFLADRDPLGARLLVDDNNGGPRPLEVIGVVGDVRQVSLDGEPTMDIYVPYGQLHEDNVALAAASMVWVARGDGGALRRALRAADAEVPVAELRPLARTVAATVAARRFHLFVLAAFAVASLLLSATGIYAMVSHSVSQRARELAIRAVLGARRRDLALLVVRQGLTPVLAGIAVGLAAALAAGRALSTMLFGLEATDPTTFAAVSLALALEALAACIGPGVRASRASL